MRSIYIIGALFFILLGLNGFIQTRNYALAKRNGKYVEVVVKKKILSRYGRTELLVDYKQKDYWVTVTKLTFKDAAFNNRMVLKYDEENDKMIDDKLNKNETLPSTLYNNRRVFILLAVF